MRLLLWSAWAAWAQPAAAQGLEVALHARSTLAAARSERAAWLVVTLPFAALGQPVAAPASTTAVAAPPEGGTPSAPVAVVAAPQLTFAQLNALSDFTRRATAITLAVAGAAAERRRLDALASRSRASAALPELRLRAQRNTDQALRWAPTSDDPYRVTQADGAGTTLEASATFKLDRLLFTGDELNVERLRQQVGSERLKLERRVLEATLGLFRARELGCSAPDPEGRAGQLLRLAELYAELDTLTAGWFSTHAASLGRGLWGFSEAILGVCSPPEPPAAPASTKPVARVGGSG